MPDEGQELEMRIRQQLDGISPARQTIDRWLLMKAAVLSDLVLSYWLLIANLVNGVIMAGALVVPAMRVAGWSWLADSLFSAYHLLCEQRPERSYFVWGYQMAMDQRMMAIYSSSLLAGLAYLPLRGRLKPLPWQAFLLLSLPMAVDGLTQLFEWRYSTWQLRTITGALFGAGTVWLAYPYLDRAIGLLLREAGRGATSAHSPEPGCMSETL